MKLIDKHYLTLQFKNKIYSKNGIEFQSFFENIIEKVFSDFRKIRPYGNIGDGGNDGYRKNSGIYYQIYAPITPQIKESAAVKKFNDDFEKLKINWDKISKIKEYNMVFNDKYCGSVQLLEILISKLKKENPNIEFKLLLAKDLEKLFFKLDNSEISNLDFNIDSRQAISNAHKYLEYVEVELDKEYAKNALKRLKDITEIIDELKDENISLEYEILECRCLQKLENIDGAKKKYLNISKRYPKDPRAFLYLAEIYLNDEDIDENEKLLKNAKEIDDNYWLLQLEELIRKNHIGEKIDTTNIDVNSFPKEPRIKANFYRLYAIFFGDSGDETQADCFVEQAIHLNPNRFSNYIAKLSILECRLLSNKDTSSIYKKSKELLNEIDNVENIFLESGTISARNKAILNLKKLNVFHIQEKFVEFEKLLEETFRLVMTCYLDKQTNQILVSLLMPIPLTDNYLNQLLEYITRHKKNISEELTKVLIMQFNMRNKLFTKGKELFKECNNTKYIDFINNIENKNYEKVLKFLDNDIPFAVNITNTLKNLPNLRRMIIENLPNDKNIQKEKLLLFLYFDENNLDEAFKLVQLIDISNWNYLECIPILKIVQEKKAWDFEIIIINKLLTKEQNKNEIFNLKLKLFHAYFNMKKYPEQIILGEELLLQDSIENRLDQKNKERLIANTIFACFERGKVEKESIKKSKEILEKYKLTEPSFKFKVGVEAEVYLNNNEIEKALKSVIAGVKIKKVISSEEYAKLYVLMTIKIGNQIDLNLDSQNKVEKNRFVKLKNKNQWYFIGDDNELDAIKIKKTNEIYYLIINKKIGDKIVFNNKYSSKSREEIIENIFSIEQYILKQTIHNFQKMSEDGVLEGVRIIDIPQKNKSLNLQNIEKFMEDIKKKSEPFFEIYCTNNNIPLSMLAFSEGGLTNAIGRIQQENKGFIHFSTGVDEFKKQKEVAKKIIDNELPFYIDGTSALILSETGLFESIYPHIPNIMVPQSIIYLLIDIHDKFSYSLGQVGHMGYAQGKLTVSSVDNEKRDIIQSNVIKSIKLLESKPKNIRVISSVNKRDCVSEQKVPAELNDACILAQKENVPILTEDFNYLKWNKLETKKETPEYFSSLALLRVLYEKEQISFEDYLDFFGYLSSYRFKFLTLNSEDIEKSVFGDGKTKIIKPTNIRKLNFPITLSEKYGVSFQNAHTVVGIFLFKVLIDNTITSNIVEEIFIELVETFPTELNKKEIGQRLLGICILAIEDKKTKYDLNSTNSVIYEKIDKLSQRIELF